MLTVRPQDVTVAIPTVFKPPTFQPIVDSANAAGAHVRPVVGLTANRAFNKAIFDAPTRYVIIATDDIAILTSSGKFTPSPGNWVEGLCRHFSEGDTWLTAAPLGGATRLFQPPISHMVVRSGAGHWRGANPVHRGHLFAVDREVPMDPIPDDLVSYFGDDWIYWHHARDGMPCITMNVTYATGREVPVLNTPQHESGWTHGQPGFEKFLGCTVKEIQAKDTAAAPKYFTMRDGATLGLRNMAVGSTA